MIRCCDYTGGRLFVTGHVYGSPDISWHLIEERGHCNALIAESIDKAEIEALRKLLDR